MDFGGQSDSLTRALRGRPSLRRMLRGVDNGRLEQFMATQNTSNSRLAPGRDKPFLRRNLEEFARTEAQAQPSRALAALEQAKNEAAAAGNSRLRGLLDRRQRQLKGTADVSGGISLASQGSPDRWGSADSIRFRGLYGE